MGAAARNAPPNRTGKIPSLESRRGDPGGRFSQNRRLGVADQGSSAWWLGARCQGDEVRGVGGGARGRPGAPGLEEPSAGYAAVLFLLPVTGIS